LVAELEEQTDTATAGFQTPDDLHAFWLTETVRRHTLGSIGVVPETRSEPTAEWLLGPTWQRLVQLSRLEPDWNSYGAEPMSGRAIHAARGLLELMRESLGDLLGERIRPYAVAPVSDGGIQLEWKGTKEDLEVEVGPQDGLSYLLVEGEAPDRHFVEQDAASSSDVIQVLARVLMA